MSFNPTPYETSDGLVLGEQIAGELGGLPKVSTLVELKALNTNAYTQAKADGRSWNFVAGDFTTLYGYHPASVFGVCVKADDTDIDTGAWIPDDYEAVLAEWFDVDLSLTNLIAAKNAAIYVGKDLVLPEDELTYTDVTGTALSIAGKLNIRGKGATRSIVKMTGATGEFVTYLFINSNDVTFQDFGLDLGSDNAGVAVAFGDCENIHIKNFDVTATRSFDAGTNKYLIHGLKPNNASTTDRVNVLGCKFKNVNYPLFTENGYGASGDTNKNWTLFGNQFIDCSNAVSLNTDFATSGVSGTWDGVDFTHNLIQGRVADSGDRTNAIAADGGKNINISHNHIKDIYVDIASDANSAIHLENLGENYTVNHNIIENCAGGIALYGSSKNASLVGNILNGRHTRALTDTVSSFADPTYTNHVGIRLVNDADGVFDSLTVSGNIAKNFDIGISTSGIKAHNFSGNVASLCGVAFKLGRDMQGIDLAGNTAENCKYVYEISSSSYPVIGKNSALNCSALFYAQSSPVVMSGLIWTVLTPSLTASSTSAVNLFKTPSRADVKLSATGRRSDLSSNRRLERYTFTIDNTPTFTVTSFAFLTSGTQTFATPFLQDSSGTLQARIFNGDGSARTMELSLDFTGWMAWT